MKCSTLSGNNWPSCQTLGARGAAEIRIRFQRKQVTSWPRAEQPLLLPDTGWLGIIPRCNIRNIVSKTVNRHRGISPLLLPKLNSPHIVTKNETSGSQRRQNNVTVYHKTVVKKSYMGGMGREEWKLAQREILSSSSEKLGLQLKIHSPVVP